MELKKLSSSQKRTSKTGRVSSPTLGQSIGMAYRSVRNRLSRTVITWFGIVLGIAFLMFTLVNDEIRASLRDLAERRATVQSMTATLRAEIGELKDKSIIILTGESIEDGDLLETWIDALGQNSPQLELIGPTPLSGDFDATQRPSGTSALVLWEPGPEVGLAGDLAGLLAGMKQRVILTYGPAPAMSETVKREFRVTHLLPEPMDYKQIAAQKDLAVNRTRWLIGVSLLVAMIGISNALLMSVTERYREIGTMKCLGALDSFIIRMILLESSFLGLTGAVLGAAVGALFAVLGYAGTYGLETVLAVIGANYVIKIAVLCMVLGWVIAVAAAIYPSWIAARMIPADALRTEV